LWINELTEAMHDLEKAIELNPKNAEAHDDLGVIYAKQEQYGEAIKHFSSTIRLDPSYQKGYHNLAMAYYLVKQDDLALDTVDKALALNPQDRNSVLLKAVILTALGKLQEAQALREDADFLSEGNWSESVPVQ
jgi:lipoprotein NlpI